MPNHTRLEEHLCEEVTMILAEGDRDFLRSLSHATLCETLEHELRFLGWYAYDDGDTPMVIRRVVEHCLHQWYAQNGKRKAL